MRRRFGIFILVTVGVGLRAGQARAQDNPGDWGMVEFNRERGLTRGMIPGRTDSAWVTFERLLTEAGVPLAVKDRASGQLGNERFRAVRKLWKSPLSRFFSCGDNLTGPNADTYHVFIRLVVVVKPGGDKTPFEMGLFAEAVDVPGGRPERLPCTTTGLFEYQMVTRLNRVFPGTK